MRNIQNTKLLFTSMLTKSTTDLVILRACSDKGLRCYKSVKDLVSDCQKCLRYISAKYKLT